MLDVMRDVAIKNERVQARDGTLYKLRITPYRTLENKIDGVVIALLDISDIVGGGAAKPRHQLRELKSYSRIRLNRKEQVPHRRFAAVRNDIALAAGRQYLDLTQEKPGGLLESAVGNLLAGFPGAGFLMHPFEQTTGLGIVIDDRKGGNIPMACSQISSQGLNAQSQGMHRGTKFKSQGRHLIAQDSHLLNTVLQGFQRRGSQTHVCQLK